MWKVTGNSEPLSKCKPSWRILTWAISFQTLNDPSICLQATCTKWIQIFHHIWIGLLNIRQNTCDNKLFVEERDFYVLKYTALHFVNIEWSGYNFSFFNRLWIHVRPPRFTKSKQRKLTIGSKKLREINSKLTLYLKLQMHSAKNLGVTPDSFCGVAPAPKNIQRWCYSGLSFSSHSSQCT